MQIANKNTLFYIIKALKALLLNFSLTSLNKKNFALLKLNMFF